MTTMMTIQLSDEELELLQKKAKELKISPEELVRISIEELLRQPDESINKTVDYVLNKNAELYRRLAKG